MPGGPESRPVRVLLDADPALGQDLAPELVEPRAGLGGDLLNGAPRAAPVEDLGTGQVEPSRLGS